MNLHAGRSADGVDWEIDHEPIAFEPADARVARDPGDASSTPTTRASRWLEDRYYVTWCNGYHGPTIGVGWTHDFETFHQLDNAFLPFNRNGVLFPRRIGGRYADAQPPERQRPHAVRRHLLLGEPRPRPLGPAPARDGHAAWSWESTKIGAGPIPIETAEGWLLLYHGVLTSCNGFVYSMGAALLDLDEPWRVVARGERLPALAAGAVRAGRRRAERRLPVRRARRPPRRTG